MVCREAWKSWDVDEVGPGRVGARSFKCLLKCVDVRRYRVEQ